MRARQGGVERGEVGEGDAVLPVEVEGIAAGRAECASRTKSIWAIAFFVSRVGLVT